MPGIIGDTGDSNLTKMIKAMDHRSDLKVKLFDKRVPALGVVYREKFKPLIWEDNSKVGVVYGCAYIQGASSASVEKVIKMVLQNPERALLHLDGSFLIACIDFKENKLVLATDKLATQPCFYSCLNDRVIFSSKIKSILPQLDTGTIDLKAIGDLIAFEFMLGKRTLVKEVKSLPSASFLEWGCGKVRIKRYWDFNYSFKRRDRGYPVRLLSYYKKSVDITLRNLDQYRIGIFLSGGLDSRLLAGVIEKQSANKVKTITFDGNPFGEINLRLGREVAECLGLENFQLQFDPAALKPEKIEKAVIMTEGMIPWTHAAWFLPVMDNLWILEDIDVIIGNWGQGEFFGEDLGAEELTSQRDPVDVLANNVVFRDSAPEKIIEAILKGRYSVRGEIRKLVLKSNRKTNYEKVLDVMYQNFYPNFHYKGNVLPNFVDVVSILPNTELLNMISCLPLNLRWRRILNKVYLYPVSPLKLELIRLIDTNLARIPYERTGAMPKSNIFMHFIRYYLKVILGRGNAINFGSLIRRDELQEYIYNLILDFGNRDFASMDLLSDLFDKHMSGKADYTIPLSAITTAEIFIERAGLECV